MQEIPSAAAFKITWLALVALFLGVVGLFAVVTVLFAAQRPIVRWERVKALALAALCVVPALAFVAFAGYFVVAPVASHRGSAQSVEPEFRRGRAYINGLELAVDGKTVRVLSSRPDSPGSAAGLKAGDSILAVDGFHVSQLGGPDSVDKLRNQSGPVPLVIDSPGHGIKTVAVDLRRLRVADASGSAPEPDHEVAVAAEAAEAAEAETQLLAIGKSGDALPGTPAKEPAVDNSGDVHRGVPRTGLLHVRKIERQSPDWAEQPPVVADEGILVALSSQRFATLAEAEEDVTSQAIASVKQHYNEEYPLSRDCTVPVPLIEKHAVRECVGEELQKDFGRMYRVHLRLQFDSALRRAVHEAWDGQVARHRLIGLGGMLGAATLVLGTCAAYLKLDDLTGGQYRRRLKLAAAALLAAGGLAVGMLA